MGGPRRPVWSASAGSKRFVPSSVHGGAVLVPHWHKRYPIEIIWGEEGSVDTDRLTLSLPNRQCSREWPCNHCQARKVPHLCQFAPAKKSPSRPDNDVSGGIAKYVTAYRGTLNSPPT